jgi:O6-methylguanine-DNA--protein-cysteine methyltransferase
MAEEVEAFEAGQALEIISGIRAQLARAETVEDLANIRDQADAIRILASKREAYKAIELDAQEIVRRVERQMAELVEELKDAGKIRRGGRPKKQPATELQDSDEQPATELQLSAREIFGDHKTQTAAYAYAMVNEDDFNDALAQAKANGDMSRQAVLRALRGAPTGGVTANGDIQPIARVMTAVFRNLAAVVERLQEFDPATIEHDDRKEWRARLTEYAQAIDAWRKALPR